MIQTAPLKDDQGQVLTAVINLGGVWHAVASVEFCKTDCGIWRGKELETIADLSNAIVAIVKEGAREDSQEFMRLYRQETLHAASNVGYIAGYYGSDTARKIWDWFECAHPIFGTYIPDPEEAFEAGQRLAEEQPL